MVVLFKSIEDNYFVNVIEWFKFHDVNYHIIDLEKIELNNFEISFVNEKLKINLKTEKLNFSFDEVSCFWYRSGKIRIQKLKISNVNFNLKVANSYFRLEQEMLIDFIYSEIQKKSIGFTSRYPVNKLVQLKTACDVGLKIPDSIICSNKNNILNILDESSIITKAIQENIFTVYKNSLFFQRVQRIKLNEIRNFSNTMFQNLIDKEVEIRTFYIENKFYSIGFCCNDENIDMRDSYQNQNHFKLKLPVNIEKKINSLMIKLNLISGSIDLIYSKTGEYYFLEVNSEGQYDWLSKLGGYNLDCEIANYIINRESIQLLK
ncbi:MAG: hypothetical protein KA521_00155 [Crocinitomicaceae bacterium]|nr:hypothetical protein [Crocinitomicaceae bacterium]